MRPNLGCMPEPRYGSSLQSGTVTARRRWNSEWHEGKRIGYRFTGAVKLCVQFSMLHEAPSSLDLWPAL